MKNKILRIFLSAGWVCFLFIVTQGIAQAEAIKSWSKIDNVSERFQILAGFNNGAVLDRETGLIWTRTPLSSSLPNQSNFVDWAFAMDSCAKQSINGRPGWRLPKIEELLNLKDYAVFGPDNTALPLGHPFLNVLNGITQYYWSSTTVAGDTTQAYGITMNAGQNTVVPFAKTDSRGVWCVRGGAN